MSYYNTTNEKNPELEIYTKINNGQDKKVLEIVKELNLFSASQVWRKYIHKHFKKATPLTSIRRSINTLKREGLIQETGEMVMGIYGRKEKQYKLS